MTATQHQSPSGESELDQYRFYRDGNERLVHIPSGPELDGYLAYGRDENDFVQVRLLKTNDEEKRSVLRSFWEKISEDNDSTICPEIVAWGEEDSVPYYVSTLPAGEPVSYFIRRVGPIPPEVAAAIVLRLMRSLQAQNPVSYEQNAMSPESLWITRSTNHQPRIILGDIYPIPLSDAEGFNTNLCLDLLKYLSGNPPFNESFQELVSSIGKGPRTIARAVEKLEEYCSENPGEDFWTDLNQPNPLLHQLVPPEAAMQGGSSQDSKDFGRRPLWQYIVGIGAAAALFGILGVAGIIQMTRNPPVPVNPKLANTPEKEAKIDNQTNAAENANSLVSSPGQEKQPETRLAKTTEKPAGTIVPPIPPAGKVNDPSSWKAENSIRADEPREKEATPEITEKTEDSPPENPAATEIPSRPQTEEEILLQIANEASEARMHNRILEAVDREVSLLKIKPNSIDARMRLNSDLLDLQEAGVPSYSAEELLILRKATGFNAKAHDLLVRHYRTIGDWEQEIASLVRFGRSGRSDKLREAGERMFLNPAASDEDRKLAREFFVEAAGEGDSEAQFFAGECMILGRGGDKDYPQGVMFLRKAVSRGDARAMDLLGVCYVRAWGVPRDDQQAVALFQAAIGNGNIPAYYNLGARYAQGQGVERNPDMAASLFEEGSAKGNAHCMLVFARCFEAGYGREQDQEKAIYWFSKSAEQGNPEAIEWCKENRIDYLKVVAES